VIQIKNEVTLSDLDQCIGYWTDTEGYIREKWTLKSGKTFIIAQHRRVYWQHLGKRLPAKIEIHHIDGNPSNNRLSNLKPVIRDLHNTYHYG